jgi:hypothetical protein
VIFEKLTMSYRAEVTTGKPAIRDVVMERRKSWGGGGKGKVGGEEGMQGGGFTRKATEYSVAIALIIRTTWIIKA